MDSWHSPPSLSSLPHLQASQPMNVRLDWTTVMLMLYAMTQNLTTPVHAWLVSLAMDSTAQVCVNFFILYKPSYISNNYYLLSMSQRYNIANYFISV